VSNANSCPCGHPLKRGPATFVLAWIDFRCRVYDVFRGNLGGVPTIHFCQWLIIDGGRRLLFLTNYDGSFENYLDDFVNFNEIGVNGIWGSSVGYPPTRLLFSFRGHVTSRDIKVFFRTNQLKTSVWYSAYPRLAVTNINKSSALRTALTSPGSGGEGAAALLGEL